MPWTLGGYHGGYFSWTDIADPNGWYIAWPENRPLNVVSEGQVLVPVLPVPTQSQVNTMDFNFGSSGASSSVGGELGWPDMRTSNSCNVSLPLEDRDFNASSSLEIPVEPWRMFGDMENSPVVPQLTDQLFDWNPWKSTINLVPSKNAPETPPNELPSTLVNTNTTPDQRENMTMAVGQLQKEQQQRQGELPDGVSRSSSSSSLSPGSGPSTYSSIVQRPMSSGLIKANITPVTPQLNAYKSGKKTEIRITPMREFNFAKMLIQFAVQVKNPPKFLIVNSNMLKVVVVSPGGVWILCNQLKYDKTKEEFHGSFQATTEVGNYKVEVTVEPKLKDQIQSYAKPNTEALMRFLSIKGSATIVVRKNYVLDSTTGTMVRLNFITSNFHQFRRRYPADLYYYCNQRAFMSAWGLACDTRTDKIYYTEKSNDNIICVDPNYPDKVICSFDQPIPRLSRTRVPSGICCDEYNGRLIVCERGRHRVSFYSLNSGEYISSFVRDGNFYPYDVAISPRGRHIVVTDFLSQRIMLFDLNGKFIKECHHKHPLGVSFDANDGQYVYVSNGIMGGSVLEYDVDLSCHRNIVAMKYRFNFCPQGLIADSSGGVLVADTGSKSIRHFATTSEDGQQLSSISKIWHKHLKNPVNMAMMSGGTLAVLEGSGRVSMF